MDILETLKGLFVEVYGDDVDVSSITAETNLRDDLGLNSIGMLSVAIAVEDKFGFRFANEDVSAIKTVQDIIDIVNKNK